MVVQPVRCSKFWISEAMGLGEILFVAVIDIDDRMGYWKAIDRSRLRTLLLAMFKVYV